MKDDHAGVSFCFHKSNINLPAREEEVASDINPRPVCRSRIQKEIAVCYRGQPCAVDSVLGDLYGKACRTGVDHILKTACPNWHELSLSIDDSAD